MPNLAQEVARARPRPHSPQTLRKSPCSTAVKIYRTQGGSEPCLPGHGPYTFADEYRQLCCGVDMDTRTAVESGGGASGHSGGREGPHRIQAPARGAQSRPAFPRYLFSIYWGRKRSLPGRGRASSSPSPALAGPPHSTSVLSLCHPDPREEMQWARARCAREPPALRVGVPWWRPAGHPQRFPSAHCFR